MTVAAAMANYSDKIRPETSFNHTGNVRMAAGSYYVPKTNKLKPLGEDAHFIFSDAQTIGVADGVGGWAKLGIDSGKYARQLMISAVLSIREHGGPVDPRKVLKEAFLNTKEAGASTACILTVEDAHLQAVNIGDSGFLHIRGDNVIYRSPTQQHFFNCPFQLSASSDSDSLSSAVEIKRVLAPGDIIVAGTDGLFDNVHEEEIEEVVKEGLKEDLDMAEMAWKIGSFALDKAIDDCAYTPFAEERQKAGNEHAAGGKYNDITVVVAYIIPAELEGFFQKMDVCPGVS